MNAWKGYTKDGCFQEVKTYICDYYLKSKSKQLGILGQVLGYGCY